MSIEEIRRAKADALLEAREAEERVLDVKFKVHEVAGKFEEFSKLLCPSDTHDRLGPLAVTAPNIARLGDEKFRNALDWEAAVQLAEQLKAAVEALAQADRKKTELGLR